MFDQRKNAKHSFYMDHLYMSVTFERSVMNSKKKKVKIHGNIRNDNRGILKCVFRIEFQNIQIADEHQNKY